MSPSLIPQVPAENLTTWRELRLIVWALCVWLGDRPWAKCLWRPNWPSLKPVRSALLPGLEKWPLAQSHKRRWNLNTSCLKASVTYVKRIRRLQKKNLPIGKGSECVMTKSNLNLNIMIWCFSGCLLALSPKLHCDLGFEHSAYVCGLGYARLHRAPQGTSTYRPKHLSSKTTAYYELQGFHGTREVSFSYGNTQISLWKTDF